MNVNFNIYYDPLTNINIYINNIIYNILYTYTFLYYNS